VFLEPPLSFICCLKLSVWSWRNVPQCYSWLDEVNALLHEVSSRVEGNVFMENLTWGPEEKPLNQQQRTEEVPMSMCHFPISFCIAAMLNRSLNRFSDSTFSRFLVMIDLHSCRQPENFTGIYRSNFIRMWEELLCEILKFINLLENILKYRYLDTFSFCTWDGELYFKYVQSNAPISGYQDVCLTFLNLSMNDDMNIQPCFFIAVDLKQGFP
jgi:hypothetical protein